MKSEPASKRLLPRAPGLRALFIAAFAITVLIGSTEAAVSGGDEPGLGDIGLGSIGTLGGADGFGGPGMDFPAGPGMNLPTGPGMDGPGDNHETPEVPNDDDKKDAQDNQVLGTEPKL